MRIKFIKIEEATKTGVFKAAKKRGIKSAKAPGGRKRTVVSVPQRNPRPGRTPTQVTHYPADPKKPGLEGQSAVVVTRHNKSRTIWSRNPNQPKKPPEPPKPENSSTEILGNKIVEGFDNLLNKK